MPLPTSIPPLQSIPIEFPENLLSINIIGPLSHSKIGNLYISIVVYCLTKVAEIEAMVGENAVMSA